MSDPASAYARAVAKGRVPAGQWHRAACERHVRDLAGPRQSPWRWDRAAAARIIEFTSHLRHTKGEWAGRPFTLEPWQQFILGSLLGWRHRETGLRRYRTAYIEVPRGSGKTTMAAALGLYLGFVDGEPGAEVYSIATKRDQARLVWDAARWMVVGSPALKRRLQVNAGTIVDLTTASKFQPLGADADRLDGLRASAVIVDELHAHRSSDLVDVMTTAMVSRRQPLVFEITTAGVQRESVCFHHRRYAEQVLEGSLDDPSWFGFIAGADPGDDWTAEATWRKANPNFGVSVKPDELRRACKQAEQMPIAQNAFRRLHLCEWLEQENRVIDLRQWDACGADVRFEDYAGRPCVVGLDLSTTVDVTALVVMFSDSDGTYTVFPFFFIPADNMRARVDRDRVPFDVWARQGLVTATPGNVTDYQFIRKTLHQLGQQVLIQAVAFDPWNASALATELASDGFQMIQVRQGYQTLSEPTKRFLALVSAGQLRHPSHSCLTWMASNFTVRRDANDNIAPDKGKATDRIDGVVALIMALGRAMLAPAEEAVSAYADHPLFTV
jgi:phage terminase large subunit-like protein